MKVVSHVRFGKRVYGLTGAQPGDTPQGCQIQDAVTQGAAGRLEEHVRRHFAAQGEQFSREAMALDAGSLQRVIQVLGHVRSDGTQPLFLLPGFAAAVVRRMPGPRLAGRAVVLVSHAVAWQRVLGQALEVLEELVQGYLELDEEAVGMSGRELVKRLRDGDPSIETLYEPGFLLDKYEGKVTINPQYMLEGDDDIVVKRIKEILTKK